LFFFSFESLEKDLAAVCYRKRSVGCHCQLSQLLIESVVGLRLSQLLIDLVAMHMIASQSYLWVFFSYGWLIFVGEKHLVFRPSYLFGGLPVGFGVERRLLGYGVE
jgi:hypothetical protein